MSENEHVDVPVMQIDDKQYAVADLTPTQHVYAAQIHDLEEQLRLNEFKHDQLLHGRAGYIKALKDSLEVEPDVNTE